jgi:hypothetical protein
MLFLAFLIVLAAAAAILAGKKNRSGVLWFILVLLFPPLILILLVLPDNTIKVRNITIRTSSGKTLTISEYVTCPQCAETIKSEARICRFCHYDLESWKNGLAEREEIRGEKNW